MGRMGSISDDGPGQHNPERNEDPWGKAAIAACTVMYQRTALLDLERGNSDTSSGVQEGRRQTARREDLGVNGQARLIYRPSSRTGENPLYGMIGGCSEAS